MRLMVSLASLFAFLALCSAGSAEILTVSSPDDVAMDGYFVNDCYVDTGGAAWLSSLFYCELESGTVYQDPAYTTTEALTWTYIPGLNPEDSWLGLGVSRFADACEMASQFGFSGDPANAAASLCVIPNLIDNEVPPFNDLAARLVLSDDASGSWAFSVAKKNETSSGWTTVVYTGIIGSYDGPIPGDLEDGFIGNGADLSDIQGGEMRCAGMLVRIHGSGGGNNDPGGGDDPGNGIPEDPWGDDYLPEPTTSTLLILLAIGGMGRWIRDENKR